MKTTKPKKLMSDMSILTSEYFLFTLNDYLYYLDGSTSNKTMYYCRKLKGQRKKVEILTTAEFQLDLIAYFRLVHNR